jgi:hypothetical protein
MNGYARIPERGMHWNAMPSECHRHGMASLDGSVKDVPDSLGEPQPHLLWAQGGVKREKGRKGGDGAGGDRFGWKLPTST